MRIRLLLSVLLVGVASLAACGDDDDDAADDTTTSTAVTSTTVATTTTEAAPPELVLAVDGLRVEETMVAFGSSGADAVVAVTGQLGAPSEEGEDNECPAGPATYARYGSGPGRFLLTMQDGAFVGWSIGPESELRFEDGIGLGSTRDEVEASLGPVEMIPDSTLGFEFHVGTVSGLLEEDAPTGKVAALWAGINCIYR